MYWNHNSAYYPWIKKKTEHCQTILDVGCGDGTLVVFLNDGKKNITGIDPDAQNIKKAAAAKTGENQCFICGRFEDFTPDITFDAVIFSASIHHMDITESLRKAKSLLSPGGILVIVGLAKPSTVTDWILEAARALPSKISSSLHHMRTSEELRIKNG